MGEESVDAYEISANVSYVNDLGYDKKVCDTDEFKENSTPYEKIWIILSN